MVLINLFYQLDFLFLLKGKDFFLCGCCLFSFVEFCFVSNVNIKLVEMWMFLIKSTS